MFANSQMMGMDMGFPDVCFTPSPVGPVPIPYPNIAMSPMTVAFTPNVLINSMPAHTMASPIPMTNGDNAGVAMGMASGTVMGPRRHITAAFTVLINGMPATRLTSMGISNSTNCPIVRIVPSQSTVVLLAM